MKKRAEEPTCYLALQSSTGDPSLIMTYRVIIMTMTDKADTQARTLTYIYLHLFFLLSFTCIIIYHHCDNRWSQQTELEKWKSDRVIKVLCCAGHAASCACWSTSWAVGATPQHTAAVFDKLASAPLSLPSTTHDIRRSYKS